jgi:hypothetical protein
MPIRNPYSIKIGKVYIKKLAIQYGVYHLKRNPTTITYCGTRMKSEAGPPPPKVPCDTRVKVTLVARPLLTSDARKLCWCENGLFTSGTCVHSGT